MPLSSSRCADGQVASPPRKEKNNRKEAKSRAASEYLEGNQISGKEERETEREGERKWGAGGKLAEGVNIGERQQKTRRRRSGGGSPCHYLTLTPASVSLWPHRSHPPPNTITLSPSLSLFISLSLTPVRAVRAACLTVSPSLFPLPSPHSPQLLSLGSCSSNLQSQKLSERLGTQDDRPAGQKVGAAGGANQGPLQEPSTLLFPLLQPF